MTSINMSSLCAVSVGTLSMKSRKDATGALPPRGIIKGAQGTPGPTRKRALRTKQRADLGADDPSIVSLQVSCIEGRRHAGGELVRNWAGHGRTPSSYHIA